MQTIVIRERGDDATGGRKNLLRYGLSANPLNRVLLDGLDHLWRCRATAGQDAVAGWTSPRDSQWVVPRAWREDVSEEGLSLCWGDEVRTAGPVRHKEPWIVVTDGRFATCASHQLVARALDDAKADVLVVNVTPDLMARRERILLTPDNQLVGYRRLFTDSVAPMPMPARWPHHMLVRSDVFDAVVRPHLLGDFRTLVDACRDKGVKMRAIAVGGMVFDLEREDGLLSVARIALELSDAADGNGRTAGGWNEKACNGGGGDRVSPRMIGPVALGRKVTVDPDAVIVGPAVLCDDCVIRGDAVVDGAIVGAGVSVEAGGLLRGCLALGSGEGKVQGDSGTVRLRPRSPRHMCVPEEAAFRTWPRFSYAASIKRVADACVAAIVLILFAPVIPVIALAVRMSSPGPVFFRDKRQGLHGKLFDCIKFRTMRQGADKMQDKLRFVCEVDGPQFKMTDDPRITTVGRFLRETYLDEIPQFFNVLCGQMSVVGPRPSPEFENTLCASWRDARLSVRPGITGLWQVCRTRAAHKDFQEWIHYDTEYVRNLSPGLDLWICWRTFRRMVENFVNQF